MNIFLIAVAILQGCAAVVYFYNGKIAMGFVFLFVAAASFSNSFIK